MKPSCGGSGCVARDDRRGERTLQGDERAIVRRLQLHVGGKARADVGVVLVLARGVDDQHEAAVVGRGDGARDHEVIDDAARVVEEERVALAAEAEAAEVAGGERLERGGGRVVVRAGEERLAHVRDVEEARGLHACACARR